MESDQIYITPSNLSNIDELIDGQEYIEYVNQSYVDMIREYNSDENDDIIGRINDYTHPNAKQRKYKYMRYVGKYRVGSIYHFTRPIKGTNRYISTMAYNEDKTKKYQSLLDWEKDFDKSLIIQKNALSNAVAQTLANSTLRTGASNIMDYLDGIEGFVNPLSKKEASFSEGSFLGRRLGYAPVPVSNYHDNKILEKQQIQEMKKKQIEAKYKIRRWAHKTLRNHKAKDEKEDKEEDEEDESRNNKLKPPPIKRSTSLPIYYEDDDVPNIAHNRTQKKLSTVERLKSIFNNFKEWQKKQSRSRVHVEKGGKPKTRKNKRKPNKRKTKRHR